MLGRHATVLGPFLSGAIGTEPDLLSVLLTMIGHDLRTPLNAVIGFSDCMEQQLFGPLGDVRYEAYARHIRESGARLLKAAEQTMALASLGVQQQKLATRRIGLRGVLEAALDEAGCPGPHGPAGLHVAVGADVEVEHNEDVIKLAIAYLMKAVALPKTDVRIACDVEFGTVMLGIDGHCPSQSEAPLASYLTLARVLLDAQGCSMKVVARPSGWRISVGLADAAQPELALF